MEDMNHTIYLTTSCNFRCTYCYEDYKQYMSLDYETLIKTIDYIFLVDKSEYRNITFMGGEPLLKKELIYNAVNYISNRYADKKVKYSLTSNCSLIDDEFIEFMKKNNFTIRVSFDGNKESQLLNRISNDKDEESLYDRILDNILKIRDMGVNYVIRSTITDNTISKIYENVVFLHENKLDNIHLIVDVNLEMDDDLLSMFTNQINRVRDYYFEQLDAQTPFVFSQFNGKFINIICDFGNHFHMCDGGVSNFKYMPNGDIYSCGFVTNNKNYLVGNRKEIINPEDGKKLAYSHYYTGPTKCTSCQIVDFCINMKCGFLNASITDFVNCPTEGLCQTEKVLYPVVVDVLQYIADHKRTFEMYIVPLLDWVEEGKLKLSNFGLKMKERRIEYEKREGYEKK